VSTGPVLEARALSVRLGGRTLLRDVDLTIGRHELHAIVGPNGAGKSTLLRALLGELPHEGEIRFHPRGSAVIGYVPQQLHVPRDVPLTVLDFLRLNLDRRPLALPPAAAFRERCRALLARTRAEGLLEHPLARLSGGEFRRVLIAQALDPTPEVLLLDEPFANLDEHSTRWLENALAALHREGSVTTVLVAHDSALVERLGATVTRLTGTGTLAGEPTPGDRPPDAGEAVEAGRAPVRDRTPGASVAPGRSAP
jgi:zinc transport system ATP-binding protein